MIFWGGTDSRQWICFRSGSQLCILESTSALSDAEILCESPAGFSGVFVMFWNSVKITVGVLAGQILVGVPAAWGFARYRFPGKICCL